MITKLNRTGWLSSGGQAELVWERPYSIVLDETPPGTPKLLSRVLSTAPSWPSAAHPVSLLRNVGTFYSSPNMAARPALPTSSSDFALPPSTSTVAPTPSHDEFNPLLLRFRRPSLLAPPRATFYSEGRINSPLAGSSFTISSRRRHRHASVGSISMSGEESESDREKMWTDSPPSADSGSNTPALTTSISGPAGAFIQKDPSTTSLDSDSSMNSSSSSSIDKIETESEKTAGPQSPPTPSRALRTLKPEPAPPLSPEANPRKVPHAVSLSCIEITRYFLILLLCRSKCLAFSLS